MPAACHSGSRENSSMVSAGLQAAAQQRRRIGLQHLVERAAPPDIARLLIQYKAGSEASTRCTWCGHIFVHGGFVGTKAPAEQAAFVHRMQRIDERVRAAEAASRPRGSGRQKPRENIGVRALPARTGLGQPCRQFAKELFIHAAIIQASACGVAVPSDRSVGL